MQAQITTRSTQSESTIFGTSVFGSPMQNKTSVLEYCARMTSKSLSSRSSARSMFWRCSSRKAGSALGPEGSGLLRTCSSVKRASQRLANCKALLTARRDSALRSVGARMCRIPRLVATDTGASGRRRGASATRSISCIDFIGISSESVVTERLIGSLQLHWVSLDRLNPQFSPWLVEM
jgi:hypothetical protein